MSLASERKRASKRLQELYERNRDLFVFLNDDNFEELSDSEVKRKNLYSN